MISKNIEETKQIAAHFLDALSPSTDLATVVALIGELGSGKTAFVKCVAEILGIKEEITSPTFVIMKRFRIEDSHFKDLVHIDAYRLESGEDLLKLGWSEIAVNPENIIFIEWPERVSDIVPSDAHKITFKFIDESTREISVIN